jgi:hypothetical protein
VEVEMIGSAEGRGGEGRGKRPATWTTPQRIQCGVGRGKCHTAQTRPTHTHSLTHIHIPLISYQNASQLCSRTRGNSLTTSSAALGCHGLPGRPARGRQLPQTQTLQCPQTPGAAPPWLLVVPTQARTLTVTRRGHANQTQSREGTARFRCGCTLPLTGNRCMQVRGGAVDNPYSAAVGARLGAGDASKGRASTHHAGGVSWEFTASIVMAPSPSVAVVVLGDVGRSPRMQYHTRSITELRQDMEVRGYDSRNATRVVGGFLVCP